MASGTINNLPNIEVVKSTVSNPYITRCYGYEAFILLIFIQNYGNAILGITTTGVNNLVVKDLMSGNTFTSDKITFTRTADTFKIETTSVGTSVGMLFRSQ